MSGLDAGTLARQAGEEENAEGGRVLTMGRHETAEGGPREHAEQTTKGCLYLGLAF